MQAIATSPLKHQSTDAASLDRLRISQNVNHVCDEWRNRPSGAIALARRDVVRHSTQFCGIQRAGSHFFYTG
jgi:hypothetical protein